MAQKPENAYISRVHEKLPGWVYTEKQNNPYVGGIPDVYYEADASKAGPGYLRVEYKWLAAENPKICDVWNPKASVRLSGLQREWILRSYNNGHPVWVIVGWRKGGIIINAPEHGPITDLARFTRTHTEVAIRISRFLIHHEIPARPDEII